MDAATNIFNSVQHCASVNSSVKQEMETRVQVQTNLQSRRDAEKKQSQEEAYKRAEAYVKTLQQSSGDIMTIASTIPAVVKQSMSVIKSDDELEKNAGSSESKDEDSQKEMEESPPVENTEQKETTSESPQTAEEGEVINLHRGNCGGRKNTDPKTQKTIIDDTKDLGKKIWDGLTNDETKSDIEKKETEGEKKAGLLAALDTGKDACCTLVKTLTQDVSKEAADAQKNGEVQPSALEQLIQLKYPMAAEIIGKIAGAGQQGGAPPNKCSTQEVTVASILGGLMANTVRSLMESTSVTKSILSLMDKATGKTCNIAWDIIDALSKMDNTSENTVAVVQMNGKINCPPAVWKNGRDHSVLEEFGIAFVDPNGDKKVGKLYDLVMDSADRYEAERRMAKANPVSRMLGQRASSSTSMKQYGKLTERGIKFARVSLGTSRQNILTDVLNTIEKSDTTGKECAVVRRPLTFTTTKTHNRHNCYGHMSYAV